MHAVLQLELITVIRLSGFKLCVYRPTHNSGELLKTAGFVEFFGTARTSPIRVDPAVRERGLVRND